MKPKTEIEELDDKLDEAWIQANENGYMPEELSERLKHRALKKECDKFWDDLLATDDETE